VKLTKSKLKQMIKEELEEGVFGFGGKQKKPIKVTYNPEYEDHTAEEWRAKYTTGGRKLPDPSDQEALDASYEIINSFLTQTKDASNVERHISLRKLINDLGSLVIYKTGTSKLRQEHNDEDQIQDK
jgi:hypothetical protein